MSNEFVNPDNLPVEKLVLSVKNAGVIRQIKALDPHWVEKRQLTLYERPPAGNTLVTGAISAWKEKMDMYLDDLKWMLGLEHHKFWSTILYHTQCMDALVSFLQEANPPYLPPHDSRDVQKLYEEIRRLVLIVFSRLVTNKESKTHWMSREHMAELLYNKFIYTVPIVWDLCLTYGVDNSRHVARMVDSVFTLQPKYEGDTVAAVAFVNEAFKYIILQVNKDYDSEGPPNLPETFKGFSEIRRPSNSKSTDKLTFDVLKDLLIHILDTAMTLRIFLEVYPKGVQIFRKTNFIISIVQLYEYGIPQLYEKLQELGDPTSVAFTEAEAYIDSARSELIDIFRETLAAYKNGILNQEGSISSHVEHYLSVLMEGLSERLLMRDYHAAYALHDDLEMLRQAYPDIDPVKTDFILQAIYANIDEPIPENLLTNSEPVTNGHVETTDNQPRDNEIPNDVREESLISEVKDILPHLGDGFILKCLKHYGFNAERVINSILEGNLAEPLQGLDQSMPIIPEDPLDQHYLATGVQRLNVFDGDEFDIMTRDDVAVDRIHLGKKKGQYRNLTDMLDDKTVVRELKNRDIYTKYNMVCDEVDLYSDEYDDTYDSDGAAPPRPDAEEPRRPLVTPRALQATMPRAQEEESEEESEDEEPQAGSSNNRSRLDFCVNPEETRARREANMRRGRGHRPPPPRNADVVGKAKGQGQEKEVLMNRERKEKHKSSRGNHNRRQGASWKRSQGMMPS
ncbi:activating signal cointegrator 1 complex subunit 2 isoform X2 [Plodia interpunctella]|uniref:activating signal cointegrator 1 complex subunit 2 isoform X2 n=1 Tax=Plodia interpunctella TaxID=58824 RepID=UPI0023687A3A|nr:activating signal cointegrator 1 complex subunit 2 isoform X2 [Plodia interpunctella]